MIDAQNLCRKEVNKRIGRIKRLFKWAASEELVPAAKPFRDHGGKHCCPAARCLALQRHTRSMEFWPVDALELAERLQVVGGC